MSTFLGKVPMFVGSVPIFPDSARFVFQVRKKSSNFAAEINLFFEINNYCL